MPEPVENITACRPSVAIRDLFYVVVENYAWELKSIRYLRDSSDLKLGGRLEEKIGGYMLDETEKADEKQNRHIKLSKTQSYQKINHNKQVSRALKSFIVLSS